MADIKPINYFDYQIQCSRLQDKHDRAMRRLKARLKTFQTTCPHKNISFQADPAGGNDSYDLCNNCGKAL
jgi:hypothetical protein